MEYSFNVNIFEQKTFSKLTSYGFTTCLVAGSSIVKQRKSRSKIPYISPNFIYFQVNTELQCSAKSIVKKTTFYSSKQPSFNSLYYASTSSARFFSDLCAAARAYSQRRAANEETSQPRFVF